jgi:hypothetical protein
VGDRLPVGQQLRHVASAEHVTKRGCCQELG